MSTEGLCDLPHHSITDALQLHLYARPWSRPTQVLLFFYWIILKKCNINREKIEKRERERERERVLEFCLRYKCNVYYLYYIFYYDFYANGVHVLNGFFDIFFRLVKYEYAVYERVYVSMWVVQTFWGEVSVLICNIRECNRNRTNPAIRISRRCLFCQNKTRTSCKIV